MPIKRKEDFGCRSALLWSNPTTKLSCGGTPQMGEMIPVCLRMPSPNGRCLILDQNCLRTENPYAFQA